MPSLFISLPLSAPPSAPLNEYKDISGRFLSLSATPPSTAPSQVILCIDELVDGGMILETDPNAIVARVLMRGAAGQGEVPLTELTIGQALASAREQFMKSMGTQGN